MEGFFYFVTFAQAVSMRNNLKNIIFLLLLFAAGVAFGQKKTKIYVERARIQSYDEKLGKDIERLIGDVLLRHDSSLFYCDSVLLNTATRDFKAYGHIHIFVNDTVELFSDSLYYSGDSKIAELFSNVKLLDNETVLTTEHLIYDRNTDIAYYDDFGKIVNKDNVLTSKKGYYHEKTKTFYFKKDVVLINPDQETHSDTLIYNTINETAYFKGPTIVIGDQGTLYCEDGWYDTKNNVSKLIRNPEISQNEQFLSADSIFFDGNTSSGKAFGRVQIKDTVMKVIIRGVFGEMWQDRGMAYVTDSATAIAYDDNDSLFFSADTLWMFFDENRNAKKILAYYNARFYRTDLQGKCDSMAYSLEDSVIRLYYEPVLWSDNNQLTADSMTIAIVNNQPDSLVMYDDAMIVMHDTLDMFNQIKGRNMVGYFSGKNLKRIHVNGNAQTVFYLKDDNGLLIGINRAEASTMEIRLRNGEISTVVYNEDPKETTFPPDKFPPEGKRLKGFSWQEDIRPKDKYDIYQRE
jgi:lipopolysaccharide export system protein LptA